MNKVMSMLGLIVMLTLVLFVAPALAGDVVAGDAIAETGTISLVTVIIVALVPIVASLLANLTEKKESDGPWARLIKNAVNLFALNFSKKAGQ